MPYKGAHVIKYLQKRFLLKLFHLHIFWPMSEKELNVKGNLPPPPFFFLKKIPHSHSPNTLSSFDSGSDTVTRFFNPNSPDETTWLDAPTALPLSVFHYYWDWLRSFVSSTVIMTKAHRHMWSRCMIIYKEMTIRTCNDIHPKRDTQ